RDRHLDRLVGIDAREVDVHDLRAERIVLHFLDDAVLLPAIELDLRHAMARVEEPEEVLQRERQRDVLLAVPVEIARKISLSSESPDRSRAELAPRPCLQHEFIHESSEASSR